MLWATLRGTLSRRRESGRSARSALVNNTPILQHSKRQRATVQPACCCEHRGLSQSLSTCWRESYAAYPTTLTRPFGIAETIAEIDVTRPISLEKMSCKSQLLCERSAFSSSCVLYIDNQTRSDTDQKCLIVTSSGTRQIEHVSDRQ